MDTIKVKLLLESGKDEAEVLTSKLFELSELDRVLSSKDLCRRQSVLNLLDEARAERCLKVQISDFFNCPLADQPID